MAKTTYTAKFKADRVLEVIQGEEDTWSDCSSSQSQPERVKKPMSTG